MWTSEDGSQFYFDKAERVRFRVEEEIWTDQAVDEDGGDLVVERAPQPADGDDDDGARARREEDNRRKNRTPWRLVASMQQGGMGVLTWW